MIPEIPKFAFFEGLTHTHTHTHFFKSLFGTCHIILSNLTWKSQKKNFISRKPTFIWRSKTIELTIKLSRTLGCRDSHSIGRTVREDIEATSECTRSTARGSAVCLSSVAIWSIWFSWAPRKSIIGVTWAEQLGVGSLLGSPLVLPTQLTRPVRNSKPRVYSDHQSRHRQVPLYAWSCRIETFSIQINLLH